MDGATDRALPRQSLGRGPSVLRSNEAATTLAQEDIHKDLFLTLEACDHRVDLLGNCLAVLDKEYASIRDYIL